MSAEQPQPNQPEEFEYEEPPRRPPWGKRPNFKAMFDGGRNKLVLTLPPEGVITYFKGRVVRPCGCAFDNADNRFYATSPGYRGGNNGTLISLDGNCGIPPLCVTKELTEASAVAVYEPGLSVCVVTNRGIFVYTRERNEETGETVAFQSRKITWRGDHRGIAVTAEGGIVSFARGKIRLLDGRAEDGQERVLAEVNYDPIINDALFKNNEGRRRERSSCCFMDVVENRLVMSDLQKHVISLWEIEETEQGASIEFVRAIDVAICENPRPVRGGLGLGAAQIPLGKCAYAAGIRLDVNGWVMCADAEGRTIQIFDDDLNFVTRVQTPGSLGPMPYISGLYIEQNAHLMVCDRRSEMGGLRVYLMEAQPDDGYSARLRAEQAAAAAAAALCDRMNNPDQGGYSDRRNYGDRGGHYDNRRNYWDDRSNYNGYNDRSNYNSSDRGDHNDRPSTSGRGDYNDRRGYGDERSDYDERGFYRGNRDRY